MTTAARLHRRALVPSAVIPPAFRAAAAANWTPGSGQVQVTIPNTVQVGDLLVLFGVLRSNSGSGVSFTTPAGWTLRDTNGGGAGAGSGAPFAYQVTYTKVAAIGDIGATVVVAFSGGANDQGGAAVLAYSGVSTVQVSGQSSGGSSSGTGSAPSITTSVASRIVLGFTAAAGGFPNTITLGAGVTQRTTLNEGAASASEAGGDYAQVSGGPTGPDSATAGSSGWIGVTVALSP